MCTMSYVLSLNSGSSSCKAQLFEMPSQKVLCSAVFERIGLSEGIAKLSFNSQTLTLNQNFKTHHDAILTLLNNLIQNKIIESYDDISAVGHRVVHGGEKYSKSVIIDEKVATDILALSALAPLHNPANHLGIMVTSQLMPNATQVAVFDTAFHQTLKPHAYLYPIPRSFYQKHKVRKYGFHGTSHRYVSAKALEALHNPNAKIIVCHLGNGASLAAIDAGKCVNTSMGFTPLAGIMMGTRSGDIDPSIIPFVQKALHLNSDDALEVFNKESGLLGVSGISSDMRDIQKAMDQGHPDAILAIEMYVERIGMLIASYIAQLKGCDAIIFTAGVGENATFIRERVIDYLTPVFKVTIDSEVNKKRGEFLDITGTDSSMKVYVIPTNEELMIALDTYQLIA